VIAARLLDLARVVGQPANHRVNVLEVHPIANRGLGYPWWAADMAEGFDQFFFSALLNFLSSSSKCSSCVACCC
jgi:hypothetical protein